MWQVSAVGKVGLIWKFSVEWDKDFVWFENLYFLFVYTYVNNQKRVSVSLRLTKLFYRPNHRVWWKVVDLFLYYNRKIQVQYHLFIFSSDKAYTMLKNLLLVNQIWSFNDQTIIYMNKTVMMTIEYNIISFQLIHSERRLSCYRPAMW